MKRTLAIVLGAATVGTAAYLAGGLWAQNPTPPAPTAAAPVQTRVALVNLSYVIKNYKKFDNINAMFKQQYTQFDTEMQALKKKHTDMDTEFKKPDTTPQRRELLEKEIKKVQREMQDKQDEAKALFAKLSVQNMETIYKEIESMAEAYAKAKGIELVLQYSDPYALTGDKYNPFMLERKTSPGAFLPLYAANGMDISKEMVENLNWYYEKSMPKQPATPPAPPTPKQ